MKTNPSPATITPVELDRLRRTDAALVLLDVRSPLEFESEHIEGSINIPIEQIAQRIGELGSNVEIATICRSGVRGTMAAETLCSAGNRARILTGGVQAWRAAGLPLKEGQRHLALDRQVQLAIGSGVLVGTALGFFVHVGFLVIPAFFGAGLVFAGASGTCGLALVLARAPWNRRSGMAASASCSTPPNTSATPGSRRD